MRKRSLPIVRPSEHGYSLTEALVVVGIIGIFSLISIPNFMGMYRSSKLKTSLRDVTSDLRAARQRAATRDRMAKFSVLGDHEYAMYDGTLQSDGTIDWTPTPFVGPKEIDASVKFTSTGSFDDVDDPVDDHIDIVFAGNGTVVNMPDPITGAFLKMKSDYDLPKAEYKITLSSAGRVSAN